MTFFSKNQATYRIVTQSGIYIGTNDGNIITPTNKDTATIGEIVFLKLNINTII
ncbi:MAG: hypothetical protein HRU03_03180 [Nanoarchaeales archaeon]|nr:hypothetical protein [Nanoarchaeales archaeon]